MARQKNECTKGYSLDDSRNSDDQTCITWKKGSTKRIENDRRSLFPRSTHNKKEIVTKTRLTNTIWNQNKRSKKNMNFNKSKNLHT